MLAAHQNAMAALLRSELETAKAMSADELAVLPPFPFPRELFPENAFPSGMTFVPLNSLPPSMLRLVDEGDTAGLVTWARGLIGEPVAAQEHRPPSPPATPRRRWSSFFGWRRRRSSSALQQPPPRPAPEPQPESEPQPQSAQATFANVSIKVPEPRDDPRRHGKPLPALHDAARLGDLSALASCLDDPACSVDERDDGERALDLAAEAGNAKAVALLLDRGADVNAQDHDGWRALHSAAQSAASAETCALLLARRADIHARTTSAALSALHVAAWNGRLGACKLLVARGAQVDARESVHGLTALQNTEHFVKTCPCKTDEPDRQWALCIQFLKAVGPMPPEEGRAFAQHSWGLLVSSALGEAAEASSSQEGLAELSHLLRCYAGDVDAQDHDGETALHSAALAGRTEAVALLLEHGASVKARSNYGDTPLHLAAREGHLRTAQLLVDKGADVAAQTRFGRTALDDATRGGDQRECAAVVALLEPLARGDPAHPWAAEPRDGARASK